MVKGQKYHILYKTTCTITGNFYIGVHSTVNLEDGYLGSGKRLGNSIKKHGKENHAREILEFFESREELIKREREIVNEDLLENKKCMNLKPGGYGGLCNEEHAHLFHKNGGKAFFLKGSLKHSEKLKNDVSYRNRYSEALSKSLTGEKAGFFGKTHTDEFKKMIGELNSVTQRGENNSQFGTMWITNGLEDKKIKKYDSIPEGWKKGRKKQTIR